MAVFMQPMPLKWVILIIGPCFEIGFNGVRSMTMIGTHCAVHLIPKPWIGPLKKN